MKICAHCKVEKPLNEFSGRGLSSSTLQSWCKDCNKQRMNATYPIRRRFHILKHKYGITKERYELMLSSQNGVCAVCGYPPRGKGNQAVLSVDHDHGCCEGSRSCGNCIRGLICHPCNIALGLLEDDPERVSGLLRYLSRITAIINNDVETENRN